MNNERPRHVSLSIYRALMEIMRRTWLLLGQRHVRLYHLSLILLRINEVMRSDRPS